MTTKKKQCSGTKGYSCGRACISVKKVCRKDGLTGQSVKLLSTAADSITQEIMNRPKVADIMAMPFKGRTEDGGEIYSAGEGIDYKVQPAPVLPGNGKEAFINNKLADKGYAFNIASMWIDDGKKITKQASKDGYITIGMSMARNPNPPLNKDKVQQMKDFMKENGIRHNNLNSNTLVYNFDTKDVKLSQLDKATTKGAHLTNAESNEDWWMFKDWNLK